MKLREKTFVIFIALVYFTGQWSCTTGRYEYPKPEPLLEKYREQLGTIGVTTGQEVPVIEFDRPLPPFDKFFSTPPSEVLERKPGILERTGRGTMEGAEKSWQLFGEGCYELATRKASEGGGGGIVYIVVVGVVCILAVPATIIGGLGGAIYGAFSPAEPPAYDETAYMEETEAILRHTLAKYPIQKTLQSAFLKEARARISHTFVVVPEEGSQPSEGRVGQSMDTVLELSVQRIWLKRVGDREPALNPPMVLVLFVRARLVRGPEKTVWYDQIFVHETKKRPYKEWPYHYHFQTAIEKAYQHLAAQMVEKLFLPKPTI